MELLLRKLRWSSVSLAFLWLASAQPAAAATPARIVELTGPAGSVGAGSYQISRDGSTVVGWIRPAWGQPQTAYAWRVHPDAPAERIDLGTLPGGVRDGNAQDVSADGSVIVGPAGMNGELRAFRWTAATGMVELDDLPGGATNTYANGVSEDGRIACGYANDADGQKAVYWTADGAVHSIGVLEPGGYSGAFSCPGDGSVIVGTASRSSIPRAFRWTAETGMQELGELLENGGSHGLSTSRDGRVVIGYANMIWGETAFRWTEETGMESLGDLPGGIWESWAWVVDPRNDGRVYGYGSTEEGDTAFLWDAAHGMRRYQDVLADDYGLVLPGWHLMGGEGLSRDGRVVTGYTTTPTSGFSAFALFLPAVCDDGLDNDGDGHTDFGDDPGCATAESAREDPPCNDGRDNDGDGRIDFADDACRPGHLTSEVAGCGVGAELAPLLGALAALARRSARVGERRAPD
jgi:probable HAF family extracellular repeat protein